MESVSDVTVSVFPFLDFESILEKVKNGNFFSVSVDRPFNTGLYVASWVRLTVYE